MAIEENDPFAVSQKFEIQSILQRLLDKRTLVRLDIPGHAVSIISTMLELDPKKGFLIVDNASDDAVNSQLLRAPSVRLQGMLDRVLIEFQGHLQPTMQDGKPALSMPWPSQLRRIQRREFFRMDVPTINPATCLIEDPSLPGGQITLPLGNISAGGLQLIDRNKILADQVIGTFFEECTLHMPDVGDQDISLRLMRHDQLLQEGDKPPLHVVACRFFNLSANHQIPIQQYVGILERAILARRWGTEE
ncbi:MAG: flagellar brake protein [Castellaniella sp.]|uniref:flagellar brake protein n=1 Tax=Castellaniella sp. TaxID=1955812 RepID=UPI003C713100